MKQTIPLIIGNWKLHPATHKQALTLATGVVSKHQKATAPYVGIAPTAVHLSGVAAVVKNTGVLVGAQTVSAFAEGAHTGEQSIGQLKNAGATFVIIGHSERRAAGETDQEVAQKTLVTLAAKVIPVVCVGESKRDKNGDFYKLVETQLKAVVKDLTPTQLKKVVIAYEPIWAIGTGKTATADDVKEMQLFIEKVLTKLHDRDTAQSVRLLYGGSVKPHNAKELHDIGGMNGFLVGGASLKAADFIAITKAVV